MGTKIADIWGQDCPDPWKSTPPIVFNSARVLFWGKPQMSSDLFQSSNCRRCPRLIQLFRQTPAFGRRLRRKGLRWTRAECGHWRVDNDLATVIFIVLRSVDTVFYAQFTWQTERNKIKLKTLKINSRENLSRPKTCWTSPEILKTGTWRVSLTVKTPTGRKPRGAQSKVYVDRLKIDRLEDRTSLCLVKNKNFLCHINVFGTTHQPTVQGSCNHSQMTSFDHLKIG